MKTMKVALLATAALAAVSVSARADDTAAIKAQLEALTARIAQLEAAPAAPVGYSLLAISEAPATVVPGLEVLNKDAVGYGDTVTRIGILPSADMPASTTIDWSGYARAAIVWVDYGSGDNGHTGVDDDLDVYARGQIKVTGKTDTAVGEVGATIEFRSNFDGERLTDSSDTGPWGTYSGFVYVEQAWGWWAMTPELTLGGGFAGSLGNIGYGYDGACTCYYTDNADVALNPGDTSQMRLTWASGPMSAAIAVEDATGTGSYWGRSDAIGAAAEVKYSGDAFNGEISAVWRGEGDSGTHVDNNDDSWRIGAGVGFALGDMASISIGAQMGDDEDDQDFWAASILASLNVSDSSHIELGYGHKDYDNPDHQVDAFLAGFYYDPVDQLTIGLEAEYTDDESLADQITQVGIVTIFRF